MEQDLRSRIVKIEQAIEQAAVQERRLTSRIEQLTALGCPKHVRNKTSGTWHKTAAADLRLRPADWCTFCGWRFSSGNFQLVEEFLSNSMVNEVLSCDVSLLRSGSLHRLPSRLEIMMKQVQVLVGCMGFQACPVRHQAKYASGLDSLYYRAVTEPHLAACDKNIARLHHHWNPGGIGRVVQSLRLC